MSAAIRQQRIRIPASQGNARYAFAGTHDAYVAYCDDCAWHGPAHCIGLESAPNAKALDDLEFHDRSRHS